MVSKSNSTYTKVIFFFLRSKINWFLYKIGLKKLIIPTLYKGCSDLPIHNFYKVLEGDFEALAINWDDYTTIENFPEDEAAILWDKIYNEYCGLTENNKALTFYSLLIELNYAETRYLMVSKIIERLEKTKSEESKQLFYDELKGWRYKINLKLSFDKQIASFKKQLKGSTNTIELLRDEIEKLNLDQEEKAGLIQQVVDLEEVLKRNEIDPKKTSVEKWVKLHNQAREKIEALRKRNKSV